MPPRKLHIAVLDCDFPVSNVYAERGTYGDIFEAILRDAASKTQEDLQLELDFSGYDCVRGCLPSVEELEDIDGIIMTGSGTYILSETYIFDLHLCSSFSIR